VASLAACSSAKNPNKPTSKGALDVSTNECMQIDPKGLSPDVSKLPIIDCSKPHTHQIFFTYQDTDDVFPGMTALEATAQQQCLTAFQPFVGISFVDSTLFVTWIVPSLDSWNDKKDRAILCVLGLKNGGTLTGSAQGTKL
jgi:hypothetical protein